jgi:hypothetical protein
MVFQQPVDIGGESFTEFAAMLVHFALKIFLRIPDIEGIPVRGTRKITSGFRQLFRHRQHSPEFSSGSSNNGRSIALTRGILS